MGRGSPGPPGEAEEENVPCRKTAWSGPQVGKDPEHLEGVAESMGEGPGDGDVTDLSEGLGLCPKSNGKLWRILSRR